jgi:hypothetical protein
MVFRSYALGLTLACAAALSFACGDDSGDDKVATERDAATDSGLPAADTGTAPVDSGTRADSGTAPVDSGARDSGTNLDSSAPKPDGSVPDAGVSDSSVGPSMACKTCEAQQCQEASDLAGADFSKLCETFGEAKATVGGGTGKLKKTLCENYLACARRTGCANGSFGTSPGNEDYACFCGTLGVSECQELKASELTGPCAIQAAEAYEVSGTSSAMNLTARMLYAAEYAGAAATWMLRCDLHICADECYDPCKDKQDGARCGSSSCGESCGPEVVPQPQLCNAKSCSNYAQGEIIQGNLVPGEAIWVKPDAGAP